MTRCIAAVSADRQRQCKNSAAAEAALRALAAEGGSEPRGWFRHPGGGRRVATTAGERDERGAEVPAGSVYVRH